MKHFPWDNLIVLLAVIRGGTLREAAKAARMSTATLSRRLDALEERLGRVAVRGDGRRQDPGGQHRRDHNPAQEAPPVPDDAPEPAHE